MMSWRSRLCGPLSLVFFLSFAASVHAQTALPPGAPPALKQFETNLTKSTIDLTELRSGGPSKGGIPSIDSPRFVSIASTEDWIGKKEPVIVIDRDGTVRAYPLQLLTYHEIVNDRIGDTPIAVTFCPLCYSSIAFIRTVNGETVSFGVSGLLRKSDLVMYDRATETLWQQFTGEAIVGTHAGESLELVPSQLISFEQFRANYPDGTVLSRETGYDRPYGRNPYVGYDDIENSPFAYDGPTDGRLPPMAKVIAISIDGIHRAYPHSVTQEQRVVHDSVSGRSVVVFHGPGAVSAVDAPQITDSKAVGSTGVFHRRIDGETLKFTYSGNGRFRDSQTGSTWTVTGRAIQGPLKGTQLERIPHGDYFAFAWLAFRPEADIYCAENE